jgi:hypothetical protein
MKGIVSVLAVLTLAGMAYAQQPKVYTPSGSDVTVPTFMNADVVRVDPAGRTLTIRADNRDTVLVVEGEGLAPLSRLHVGDHVMLGYRVDGGRRVVTNIREVVPSATPAAAAPSRATTIESVRVVAVNPAKRTLTVRDTDGARHVLSTTTEAARALRGLRVGDDVVLSYRAGKGRTRTVVRIEPVGVGTSGTVTQIAPVVPVSTVVVPTAPVVVPATGANVPVVVTQAGLPATGGIPVPPNAAGAPAVLQPVPNVGPPTSPTLNVALPPANAGTMPDAATPAQADAIRAQGVRDLQAAAGVLALKANEADNLWYAFKSQCLGGTTPSGASTTTGREWFILLGGGSTLAAPSDDACRQRLADLNRCATLFQDQLGVTLDAARRADVPPGTVREILQRNRLDR